MKKLLSLFAVLFIFVASSTAQVILPTRPTAYGSHFNRVKIDSALHIPEKDAPAINSADTSTQIFYNRADGKLWIYSRHYGFKEVGSAVIDPTSYSLEDVLTNGNITTKDVMMNNGSGNVIQIKTSDNSISLLNSGTGRSLTFTPTAAWMYTTTGNARFTWDGVTGAYNIALPNSVASGFARLPISANGIFADPNGNIQTINNVVLSDSTTFSSKGIVAYVDNSKNIKTIAQPGGTYTSLLSDNQRLIAMSSATPNVFVIPPHSSVPYPIGSMITITWTDTGQTTIIGGSGVTINSADGRNKLRVKYSVATVIQTSLDVWLISGDITN